MVDPKVISAVRDAFGNSVLRVLVTGGTGFIGSRVAWLLAEAGQRVTIAGRNPYRLGRAFPAQAKFVACDIEDGVSLRQLCSEQDAVVHAAALTSPWGPWRRFALANVAGTRNVIEACKAAPAVRLVHVSSTAIHFKYRDQLGVPEDAPLPKHFACPYARSKAQAEELIRAAVADGLNAVIVRARAAIGPGDNSLLPRLLAAARRGRLRRIGRGYNRTDLTYIDNLAYALGLAVVRGSAGSVCTVTNEEPVDVWTLVDKLVDELELPPLRPQIPYRVALGAAGMAETWALLRRPTKEPLLTRYGVGLLAHEQTFSPAAARDILGYHPLVSIRDGIRRTIDALTARDTSHASVVAKIKLFTTGYTLQRYGLAEPGRGSVVRAFHGTCVLIRHPRRGLFLFDTGYAPRFADACHGIPYRLYGQLAPAVTSPQLTIVAQLAEEGIAATDIRGIILSHFHADHIAGLRDFPEADIIASQKAWEDVAGRRGLSALRRGLLPALVPEDLERRLRGIGPFHDPGFGPWSSTHDLFGDGSVRLVELPGHACGQIGALVQTGPKHRTLLAADSTWTLGCVRSGTIPHLVTRVIVDSVRDLRETLGQLQSLAHEHPEIEIIPTHCPEVAEHYGLDNIVKARLSERDPFSAAGVEAVIS